jgi:hypothetical protein
MSITSPESLSAVKTGPTGRTILLPTEEVAAYEALVKAINQKFWPDTYQEKLLAQAIVDHEWRLRRISRLEESLHALGRKDLSAAHTTESDPQTVTYKKLFKQLSQQERFLRRQLKKDTAELNQLLRDNPKSRRGLFLVPKPQQKS